jgi:biotin synthase-like enzyme
VTIEIDCSVESVGAGCRMIDCAYCKSCANRNNGRANFAWSKPEAVEDAKRGSTGGAREK